jgi:hypothetical protein
VGNGAHLKKSGCEMISIVERESKTKYFKRLLKDFERACEHKVMKGSYPPEEFTWCDLQYQTAREKIINYFDRTIGDQ